MSQELDQMVVVTKALFLREYRKISALLAEEARLRQAISRLDIQVREAHETLAEDQSMQILGAEILWQAWASRSRRELNIELARLLSRKLVAMQGVRKAFGREQAVATMQRKAKSEAARKAAAALHQSLLPGN